MNYTELDNISNGEMINGQKLKQVLYPLLNQLVHEPKDFAELDPELFGTIKPLEDKPYFEKISQANFVELVGTAFKNVNYDDIKLPKRATAGSAGYDFFTLESFSLKPGESKKIYTGIRCHMPKDLVLLLYPRSGHGFKYKIQLANTVGVIDSDYYNSDNEGHIIIKIFNDNRENKTLNISKGDAIAQGIFVKYYTTIDDNTTAERNGGFGSTNISREKINNSDTSNTTNENSVKFDGALSMKISSKED